jgi:NAD(P)-dependent dehydrogenase (short-subunit alcohol dehydrogenase family)
MRLKDKVAIITGAGKGLGKAFAERFSKEGAKIIVADIDLDAAKTVSDSITSQGGEALSVGVDISDEQSVNEMVKRTIEKFGKIDILVNNAAIMLRFLDKPLKAFYEYTIEEWDRVINVNVRGTWLCCKAVSPHMIEQKKGKIINLASSAAYSGVPPQWAPYITSKGAILSFTKTIARELGPFNINVNGVAPGMTHTETVEQQLSQDTEFVVAAQAIKRKAVALDIVGAVLFLASEDSDFLAGETIIVDGGLRAQ